MDVCYKFYSVSGLRDILAAENYEENILNSTKYVREYLHRDCKSQLIEEILQKIPNSTSF